MNPLLRSLILDGRGRAAPPSWVPYLYVNVARPTFSPKFGLGDDANYKPLLRPAATARRIIVDGTTSGPINSYWWHAATLLAAKALATVDGAWILLPGGGTLTSPLGLETLSYNNDWNSAPFKGTSVTNMFCIGTFDPAHNTDSTADEVYYNTLRFTVDCTGCGLNAIVARHNGGISGMLAAPYCAFMCLYFIAGPNDFGATAELQTAVGGGHFRVIWNCTFERVTLVNQGANDPPNSRGFITSLTSVGTTATAGCGSPHGMLTGDLFTMGDDGSGATRVGAGYLVTGAVVTVVNSNTFTYPMAAAAASPDAGPSRFWRQMNRYSDSSCQNDTSVRHCGFLYQAVKYHIAKPSGVYADITRRHKLEACVFYHCGYGKSATRDSATTTYIPYLTSKPITSILSSGTTASVTTPTPHGRATGDEVIIGGATPDQFNTAGPVGNVNATPIVVTGPSSFTYQFSGAGGAAATGTLTFLDMQEWGWNPAVGAGPDYWKHAWYYNDTNEDMSVLECVMGFNAANAKLTGGPATMQNNVYVYEPMPYIFDAFGNNSAAFPRGAIFTDDNSLFIKSADLNHNGIFRYAGNPSGAAGGRGYGPWVIRTLSGSYIRNALMLDNSGVADPIGIRAESGGVSSNAYAFEVSDCVLGGWTVQDTSTTPASSPAMTIAFNRNFWEAATIGTNTNNAAASPTFRVRLAAARALTLENLRSEYLGYYGSVVVGGTPEITAMNMLEFMARNPYMPGVRSHAALFQTLWRRTMAGA